MSTRKVCRRIKDLDRTTVKDKNVIKEGNVLVNVLEFPLFDDMCKILITDLWRYFHKDFHKTIRAKSNQKLKNLKVSIHLCNIHIRKPLEW
ncbi:hypothetical protein FWK35_00029614 [Aphis craccivora]|uniref:Uncharacterized protein n=1 Tax=Aphis craccivora TaxID=307492 RepID=A0A6G0VYS7_APHCR|nr:hypothetical protein FWK35_00029614 [Aphis craccivora]